MDLADLIQPDCVIIEQRFGDKLQLLQALARRAGDLLQGSPQAILQALQAREQLGSTGLGRGFALPHARIEGIKALFGMFVRLNRPVAYQAIDEQPVDLIFLLLIPADAGNEHITALATISRHLRDPAFVVRLRHASTPALLHAALTGN
jgi:PTS system nitrogen regulatory IIA component